MYGTSQARLIQITDDQMKLIAHALSLVDRSKVNFTPNEPFMESTQDELDSLQGMFGEDNSQLPRDTVLGFCF